MLESTDLLSFSTQQHVFTSHSRVVPQAGHDSFTSTSLLAVWMHRLQDRWGLRDLADPKISHREIKSGLCGQLITLQQDSELTSCLEKYLGTCSPLSWTETLLKRSLWGNRQNIEQNNRLKSLLPCPWTYRLLSGFSFSGSPAAPWLFSFSSTQMERTNSLPPRNFFFWF